MGEVALFRIVLILFVLIVGALLRNGMTGGGPHQSQQGLYVS